jgi:hypothetical protein
MEEQFVDDAPALNYQLGSQQEDMAAVEAPHQDHVLVEVDHAEEKIVVTNAAIEATSLAIVVAVDVAGNCHPPCVFSRTSKR